MNIEKNYLTVQGWMVSKLGLKGNQLLVFALIHGFSQDRETEFRGSIRYICTWLNCSKNTAIKAISDLVEFGLITKRQEVINGVIFNRYSINEWGVQKLHRGSAETAPGGSAETAPNKDNIDTNKDKDRNKASTTVELFFSEAVEVIDFLNEKTNRDFASRAANGKGNRKKVSGLMKSGATVEEIKNVILLKAYEWNWNPDMFAYLRPETLFRPSNFKKYKDEVEMLRKDKIKAEAWRGNIDKKRARLNGSARPAAVATPEGVAEALRILDEDY